MSKDNNKIPQTWQICAASLFWWSFYCGGWYFALNGNTYIFTGFITGQLRQSFGIMSDRVKIETGFWVFFSSNHFLIAAIQHGGEACWWLRPLAKGCLKYWTREIKTTPRVWFEYFAFLPLWLFGWCSNCMPVCWARTMDGVNIIKSVSQRPLWSRRNVPSTMTTNTPDGLMPISRQLSHVGHDICKPVCRYRRWQIANHRITLISSGAHLLTYTTV